MDFPFGRGFFQLHPSETSQMGLFIFVANFE